MGGPPVPLLPTEDEDSCLTLSDSQDGAKATLGEDGDVGPESGNGTVKPELVAPVEVSVPLGIWKATGGGKLKGLWPVGALVWVFVCALVWV